MGAPNLKPWKPGQTGNPGGRPKLPEELRGISSLTQLEVCKLVSRYARMTRDELQATLQDTKTPMIEITIASIFAQAAKNGDFTRLAFLLDRAIGKVLVINPESGESDLADLTTTELLRLIDEKKTKVLDAG